MPGPVGGHSEALSRPQLRCQACPLLGASPESSPRWGPRPGGCIPDATAQTLSTPHPQQPHTGMPSKPI